MENLEKPSTSSGRPNKNCGKPKYEKLAKMIGNQWNTYGKLLVVFKALLDNFFGTTTGKQCLENMKR